MKRAGKLLEKVVLGADLSGEALPGLPLLELIGEYRVLIENHYGVSNYSCNEICVKVTYGAVRILGDKLEIARMTKQQLVITGVIDHISLQRRE
ncbi:MAG: YabP/YqfC family sporulation protein [Oscillospiraceae bacterium]|nr:YabP/YqfC family sporulation protein [Oscillospiraceae bacterium]